MVPAAFLAGHDIVRTCMEDPAVRAFLEGALFEEIIPTLSLPRTDCEAFARAVEERFSNPYIDHRLLDIALNSVSKWRARVLPSVNAFLAQNGRAPGRLTFSFAALAAFYTQAERVRPCLSGSGTSPPYWTFLPKTAAGAGGADRRPGGPHGLLGGGSAHAARLCPGGGQVLARIRADGMAAVLADCR